MLLVRSPECEWSGDLDRSAYKGRFDDVIKAVRPITRRSGRWGPGEEVVCTRWGHGENGKLELYEDGEPGTRSVRTRYRPGIERYGPGDK